jgi:DNA-binding NtrC family response regulator
MDPTATLQVTGLRAGVPARGASVVLRVQGGDDDGKQLVVRDKPAVIGSGGGAALLLSDKSVSRQHAEVRAAVGGLMVADLGSTNGTRIGGARVLDGFVPFGGELVVGETVLRVLDGAAPQLEPSTRDRFGGLIGTSRAMREVFAVLEAAAPSDATVLVEGPSGTGKELVARAVHDHSPRAGGPFVALNLGSTTKDLLQAALMGHKKGAFTGAHADRAGAFVEAHGGTLFLDELGELPLESQAHLLRALEAKEVVPVGGDRPRKVDVRLVAATNRDLQAMVDSGALRLDLFHRLAVVHLRLPALKDRPDDIPAIVAGFYRERGLEAGPIDGPNLDALRAHPFPGNVRELKNVLERSWVLSRPDRRAFRELTLWLAAAASSTATHVEPVPVDASLPFKEAKEQVLERFEAAYLQDLMTRFDGNISQAARHAALSRRHLRALCTKHGVKAGDDLDDDDAEA